MNAPGLTQQGRTLWRQLLHIGWAAGRSGTTNRIRQVALGSAVVALTLALATMVAVFATYDGREARAAARTPTVVGSPTSPTSPRAGALWADKFDDVQMRQFSVIYIEPLHADAPLPPGVSRWPGPGEAVLSPALLEAGASAGISSRYGRTVGTIGEAGLASPGERLAYVRPPAELLDRSSMMPISGYGAATPASTGDLLAVKPPYVLLVLILFVLVLPVGALAVAAARTGSDARDRRTELLNVLGGGWRTRAALNVGEAFLPTVCGAVLGALLTLPAFLTNITLPGVSYHLAAADIRSWAWAVLGSTAAALLLVLLAVVLLHPRRRGRGTSTRPEAAASRLPRWWPYLCPAMLLIAVRGPELAPDGGGVRLLVYAIGVIGTVATLPSLLALGCAGAGRALAAVGQRSGRTGALVAGRWMAAWPGTTTRLTSGVVIAFVLIGQVQLWQSRNSGPAAEARATQQRVGSSVVVVELPQIPEGRLDAFLGQVPVGAKPLWLSIDHTKGSAEIEGACAALSELRLPCTPTGTAVTGADVDDRVRELANWHTPRGTQDGGLTARASNARPRAADGQLLVLVGTSGTQLSVAAVKTAANAHLASSPVVGTIGSSWLYGANLLALQSQWVLFFGAAGVLVIAAAIALGNLAEFLRFARRISALCVLTGRRTIFFSVSVFTLFLPLVLAGTAGLLAHLWLATPLTSSADSLSFELSWSMLYATLGGSMALALLVWLWGAASAIRQSRLWRPNAD